MAVTPKMFEEGRSSKALLAMPFHEIVEKYLRYYAAGEHHTARAKRLDLKTFCGFLMRYRGVSGVEKLTVDDWDFSSVQRFVDDRLGVGEAPATVARRLATVKHMGRTLAEKVAGFVNPAKEVKAPKIEAAKPKGLDARELAVIRQRASLRAKEKPTFIRARNQLLFEIMLATGLRADEVRLLKRGQVDDDFEWFRNVKTKGKRFRNVYLSKDLREPLRRFLELREREIKRVIPQLSQKQSAELPLFPSLYGARAGAPEKFVMGAKTLWRAVRELSADSKLHPHLLRHSFALGLLESARDIRLVAQALGHSDVRVTMRYTERNEREVAEALERARKRGKRSILGKKP